MFVLSCRRSCCLAPAQFVSLYMAPSCRKREPIAANGLRLPAIACAFLPTTLGAHQLALIGSLRCAKMHAPSLRAHTHTHHHTRKGGAALIAADKHCFHMYVSVYQSASALLVVSGLVHPQIVAAFMRSAV